VGGKKGIKKKEERVTKSEERKEEEEKKKKIFSLNMFFSPPASHPLHFFHFRLRRPRATIRSAQKSNSTQPVKKGMRSLSHPLQYLLKSILSPPLVRAQEKQHTLPGSTHTHTHTYTPKNHTCEIYVVAALAIVAPGPVTAIHNLRHHYRIDSTLKMHGSPLTISDVRYFS
jgi:hypothetical protein